MEYTWRITAESLTVRATIAATPPSVLKIDLCAQLLDDDDEVVGRLYSNCALIKGRPVPVPALSLQPGNSNSNSKGASHSYIELENLPSDELLEVIGMSYTSLALLHARHAAGTS